MRSLVFDFKLLSFIILSLIFLAANSILCRMALITSNIDAYTFTFIRVFSGALTLLFLYFIKYKKFEVKLKTNWLSSLMLFLYAICFSYSYLNMQAGIGTLILFAIVQLSMIIIALFYKEKLTLNKLLGIFIAFSGLAYLLYPKEDFSLSFEHALLMVFSGIAWGIYTVLGKKSKDAFFNTSDNFIKASFFAILFFIFFIDFIKVDSFTFLLAFISGALTSAIGYLLWYEVLPKMQIITASILQLLVPILAIVLSIIFLDEKLSLTLVIATFVILFGILITLKKGK
ncbi:EamA family transporter [Malaciobacter mytili]|uniref:DMT family transporter n=1 Tax=Malaciobacter mytili TaxID=603050 RepID=UPI00100AFC17|nr:DMT family transporter [Malaciobacter mytili]RXI37403.1 EamA family transporter [Malaciobacter mytili]